jgi:hypothetical protein
MAFNNEAPFQVRKHIALLNGVNVETISGDKTLTLSDSTYQILNGGAADRDVNLPAEWIYQLKPMESIFGSPIRVRRMVLSSRMTAGQQLRLSHLVREPFLSVMEQTGNSSSKHNPKRLRAGGTSPSPPTNQ